MSTPNPTGSCGGTAEINPSARHGFTRAAREIFSTDRAVAFLSVYRVSRGRPSHTQDRVKAISVERRRSNNPCPALNKPLVRLTARVRDRLAVIRSSDLGLTPFVDGRSFAVRLPQMRRPTRDKLAVISGERPRLNSALELAISRASTVSREGPLRAGPPRFNLQVQHRRGPRVSPGAS